MKVSTGARRAIQSAWWVLLGVCSGLFLQPVSAVDFDLRPQEVEAVSGDDFTVDVYLVNDQEDANAAIQAFQLAISHDATFLEYVDAAWQETALAAPELRGGEGPEFFSAQAVAGGMTLGVVFDLMDLDAFLLSQGDHLVSKLTYRGVQATAVGQTTPLDFALQLGEPPIANNYETRMGTVLEPATKNGLEVTVTEADTTQIYSIHFDQASVETETGVDITLPVFLDNNPQDVFGFSFGIAYDVAVLELMELRRGSALASAIEGSDTRFYAEERVTDGGGSEEGVIVALILFDESDLEKSFEPRNRPHHLFDAVFRVQGDGVRTTVSLSGELGEPQVEILMDLTGGVAQAPTATSPPAVTEVEVTVGEVTGVPFIRGDVDQSGRHNITDVINMLNILFDRSSVGNPKVLETDENCKVAFDVNGDNRIDVADPTNLLRFIFPAGGQRPPEPFPDCGTAAGVDPSLVCSRFDCQ